MTTTSRARRGSTGWRRTGKLAPGLPEESTVITLETLNRLIPA
ncbi:hypothetical protein [Amycolatopsis sp. Hca4]|nr:hypothetical protein [Amycolatopsis sp. Hca4]